MPDGRAVGSGFLGRLPVECLICVGVNGPVVECRQFSFHCAGGSTMAIQFLLYLMTILLFLIFWELSKIHSRIKKAQLNPTAEPALKGKEAVKV